MYGNMMLDYMTDNHVMLHHHGSQKPLSPMLCDLYDSMYNGIHCSRQNYYLCPDQRGSFILGYEEGGGGGKVLNTQTPL